MTTLDTPVAIRWGQTTLNRGPVVRTMTTELDGVRYRVSVEDIGRRNASRRRLDRHENSTSLGLHATTDDAVDACIRDMGLKRSEVEVSFHDAKSGQPVRHPL